MAAVGHAYPSDEEEHGHLSTVGNGSDGQPDQASPYCHVFPGGGPTPMTPPPPRLQTSAHQRRCMSDQRRCAFRLNNGPLASSAHCSEVTDGESFSQQPQQPARSRSEGETVPPQLSSENSRYVSQPSRERAYAFSQSSPSFAVLRVDLVRTNSEQEASRDATDFSDIISPPRRMRARTLSHGTPSTFQSGLVDTSADLEQGRSQSSLPVGDEATQRSTTAHFPQIQSPQSPQVRTESWEAQTSSAAATQARRCRRWMITHGRRARVAVCVGLYVVLMAILPLRHNPQRDQTGLLNGSDQQQNKLESDFGREIHFKGMGMTYAHGGSISLQGDLFDTDKSVTGDRGPVTGKPKGESLSIGSGKDLRKNKAQHKKEATAGKKKRRPVLAHARTLEHDSAPIFVPKVPNGHQSEPSDFDERKGRQRHHEGRTIQTFVLPEEELLSAPTPEDLLPPKHDVGPSTLLKIVALTAWVCLSMLVLETGCREVQRRFQYVHLRQMRVHSEARLR